MKCQANQTEAVLGPANVPSGGGRCKLYPGRTSIRKNTWGLGYEEAIGFVSSPVNGVNTKVHLRQL